MICEKIPCQAFGLRGNMYQQELSKGILVRFEEVCWMDKHTFCELLETLQPHLHNTIHVSANAKSKDQSWRPCTEWDKGEKKRGWGGGGVQVKIWSLVAQINEIGWDDLQRLIKSSTFKWIILLSGVWVHYQMFEVN